MNAPNDHAFVESFGRANTDWNPELIRLARRMADSGNLTLMADFCEAVMGDDRVMAALGTRTKGLIGLPLEFEPGRGRKRPVKALEIEEDWWDSFPENAVSQLMAWGILAGVGLAELVWDRKRDKRWIPRLKIWNPRNLRWDWQTRQWRLRTADGEITITPGDGKWVLYMPYGDNRPWAWGAWRAVGAWWMLKYYAIQDWGFYSEKHGQGTMVSESPEGSTKERRKELAADIFEMGRNSAVVLPPGFKLSLVESTANTWQTFQEQKNAADMAISVAILGQNLSTEVSGPVSTGATLHGKVLQVYIDADAETLSTTLHDQALTHWATVNFGNPEVAPWPRWKTTPPSDRKSEAEALNTLAQALNTLSNSGAPVDIRAVVEHFGLPLLSDDAHREGQVFKYHLDYSVLTLNEIRERLGLPPVVGGDVPPKPASAAPVDPKVNPDSNPAPGENN